MNQKAEEQALTVQEGEILDSKNAGIVVKDGSLDYENFVGLWRLSKLLVMSGMVPKVKEKDGVPTLTMEERISQIAVSIARGRCVGLDAFQSVESIVPINGRPMIWGNAPLAICRQSPAWDESGFDEYWEVKGTRQDSHPAKFDDDSITAVCETLRKGAKKPMVRRFSVADAKRSGLWGATGKLYGSYPQRMLPARARGYCLNDNFGDSLKGIQIRETFDEEVDGKQTVSNVDELREQMDKRKRKDVIITSPDGKSHAYDNNAGTIKEAMKQSFPEGIATDKKLGPTEMPGQSVLDGPPKMAEISDLDIARDVLKGIYRRIPMKMNPIEALKEASMEDGSWIGFEHIDSISDVDYLNRITANLEEMLTQAVGAKA